MSATGQTMHESGRMMQRAAWAAVGVASLLVLVKAAAYIVTDSIAMMSSLADSALDVFTSSINLIAIHHALTPADHEHRFGHGKAEPLAGLFQAAFISGSVAFLLIESISRLIEPHKVEKPAIGITVMIGAIVATLVLVAYQQLTIRKTGSIAVGADRMHYAGDVLVNAGVIFGIFLSSQFGWLEADPLIGIAISAVLAFSAWSVFVQSTNQLMDRELPDEVRDRIKAVVLRHAAVRNIHDLRTRAAGINTFIQFHIELDPTISLMRAHEVSDEVEKSLCAQFPNAEVIIHQDPAGVEMPPSLAVS